MLLQRHTLSVTVTVRFSTNRVARLLRLRTTESSNAIGRKPTLRLRLLLRKVYVCVCVCVIETSFNPDVTQYQLANR